MSTMNSVEPAWKKLCKKKILWEHLFADLREAFVNGTELSGLSKNIIEIVFAFAGTNLCPISHIAYGVEMLKKTKTYYQFVDKYFDRQLPSHPKLPYYKRENGGLVECIPSEALPRQSRWNLEIYFRVFTPRRNSKKKPNFSVSFRLVYRQRHCHTHLPTTLDAYKNQSCHPTPPATEFVFRREGDLNELLQHKTFLFHLREIILAQGHRLREIKFCNRIVTVGTNKRAYKALCGCPCPTGSEICISCCASSFVNHFF